MKIIEKLSGLENDDVGFVILYIISLMLISGLNIGLRPGVLTVIVDNGVDYCPMLI